MDANTITMQTAKRLYSLGNIAGLGYPPYTDEPGDDTIENAVAAAERDGWTVVLPRHTSDGIAVLSDADGAVMAIGADAQGRGAWAVVISEVDDSAETV